MSWAEGLELHRRREGNGRNTVLLRWRRIGCRWCGSQIHIDDQGGSDGRRLRWRESAEVVGCAATKDECSVKAKNGRYSVLISVIEEEREEKK